MKNLHVAISLLFCLPFFIQSSDSNALSLYQQSLELRRLQQAVDEEFKNRRNLLRELDKEFINLYLQRPTAVQARRDLAISFISLVATGTIIRLLGAATKSLCSKVKK